MKTLTKTLTIAALSTLSLLSSAQNGSQYIRITVTENSNMPTQAPASMTIQFSANGNDNLSGNDQGNAASLGNFNAEIFPFTLTSDNYVLTGVDDRTTLSSYRSIPFGIVSKDSGSMKIIAETGSTDPNMDAPYFVWLEQISTGEHFSILDTVKFNFQANSNFSSDFIIHVGPESYSSSTDETCFGYNNGEIYVAGPNFAGFTYQLSHGANTVYSGTIAGIDTNFTGLPAGNYVGVIRVNGIPVDSSDVIIGSPAALIADFTTDYNYINTGDIVNFTDNSTGAVSYDWTFGDGNETYTTGSESHTYGQSGVYYVTLLITDANGCQASTYDIVTVDSASSQAANNHFFNPHQGGSDSLSHNSSGPHGPMLVAEAHNQTETYFSNEKIVVVNDPASVLSVTITSINGSVIASGTSNDARTEYAVPAHGVYVVTTQFTDGTAKSQTVLAQ
jgi:PKD repeat protein